MTADCQFKNKRFWGTVKGLAVSYYSLFNQSFLIIIKFDFFIFSNQRIS